MAPRLEQKPFLSAVYLQAWQVTHQPARGSYLMGTKPAVHRGFQQSWQASDLSKRITQRVLEVVKARYEADKSLLKCKVRPCRGQSVYQGAAHALLQGQSVAGEDVCAEGGAPCSCAKPPPRSLSCESLRMCQS